METTGLSRGFIIGGHCCVCCFSPVQDGSDEPSAAYCVIGQKKAEYGSAMAFFLRAADKEGPVMAVYDLFTHPQTKAGATGSFGGIGRIP